MENKITKGPSARKPAILHDTGFTTKLDLTGFLFQIMNTKGLHFTRQRSAKALTRHPEKQSDPHCSSDANECFPITRSMHVHSFKGTPITKALTCMKIYLYKQKWQFCQGDVYCWLFCCLSNFCISHRLIYIQTYSF